MPQETQVQTIHAENIKSEGMDALAPLDNPNAFQKKFPGLDGKYTILEKIGKGAQGTVFKASTPSGEIVAIKVFDFRDVESWKEVDLLKREVETLKKLKVDGIPKFIEFIEDQPYSYLVESYIKGTSLADMLSDGFEPTFEQTVGIFTEAMKILHNLHAQLNPVIHRDIKPGNLIVNMDDDDIRVWIVDFGTVAAARQRTNASTFAGTAGYVAPEQLFGKATPASDIYSMGMTMIHLISGVAPCDMEMDGLTVKYDKYLPIKLPFEFKKLLTDMVAPNPNNRIKSAEHVLFKLKQFAPVKKRSEQSKPARNVLFQAKEAPSGDASSKDMNLKIALDKLENFKKYSEKEKETLLRELHEYNHKQFEENAEYVKLVLDTAKEHLLDVDFECVAFTVINLMDNQALQEEQAALLNRLEKYHQYSLEDKKVLLRECYKRTEQSYDAIIECIKNVLDAASERNLDLSIESLIDAAVQRIKKQAKHRQKLMPEELELYGAVDRFDGYSIEERKNIIIQLYRQTGMNCSDIVRHIHEEQKTFTYKKLSMDELISYTKLGINVYNNKLLMEKKSVLDEIRYALEFMKEHSIKNKSSSDTNHSDEMNAELSLNDMIEQCPELKRDGFTNDDVLEIYAEQLFQFEIYSVSERKEMIIKCWDRTRETMPRIILALAEVLSSSGFTVKRRTSDIVDSAEQLLNQKRAHRIELVPPKEDLDKWSEKFDGYNATLVEIRTGDNVVNTAPFSKKDKEEILTYLFQETGRDCEQIVEAIQEVKKNNPSLNTKQELIAAVRAHIFNIKHIEFKQSDYSNSSAQNDNDDHLALSSSSENGTIRSLGGLCARMREMEAPINYKPIVWIVGSIVGIIGALFGCVFLYQRSSFWGAVAAIFVLGLIVYHGLLLLDFEPKLWIIFLIGSIIAVFFWSWVAGIIYLLIALFVIVPAMIESS